MPPATVTARPGQIWRDDCYYLDRSTGQCQRKYLLVLAVDHRSGDAVTAVFTSKSHGLTEQPACSLGPPRAGCFVGVLGGVLPLPSWVDFSSLQDLDAHDLLLQMRSGRKTLLTQTLPTPPFCMVLRCLLGYDDLTGRQSRLVGDVVAGLGCP
jgi:hypothetical protein